MNYVRIPKIIRNFNVNVNVVHRYYYTIYNSQPLALRLFRPYAYLHLQYPTTIYSHNKHNRNVAAAAACRPHLFTRVQLATLVADVALHVTAPNELAAALPRALRLVRVVAAAAAQ